MPKKISTIILKPFRAVKHMILRRRMRKGYLAMAEINLAESEGVADYDISEYEKWISTVKKT